MSGLRISFLLLLALILLSAGLTIGLTYAPCYSALCVEQFHSLTTRIHIAVFYALVSTVFVVLTLRKGSRQFRQFCSWHLTSRRFLGLRISVGGLLLFALITGVSICSTSYWLPEQQRYWIARGEAVQWTQWMFRVVWTAVTGHWIDMCFGLVVMPVGRNSLIGRTFDIESGTLLLAHKLLAYALLVGGLIHGFLYYSFLASWVAWSSVSGDLGLEFLPDNPTVTWDESRQIGVYSWFPLPTGAVAGIILIPVMVITSLPYLRKINYNVFYYIHIVFAIAVMVLLCMHASTNFYFVFPGLVLWISDWVWRMDKSLRFESVVMVDDAGVGWYRITLPQEKDVKPTSDVEMEPIPQGDSNSISPLATYYVRIKDISRFQLHPFSVASLPTTERGATLLFRKSPARSKESRSSKEWTWKLAKLAEAAAPEKYTMLKARLEGPISPSCKSLYSADHVIAIVGGTGITGALSIARWWNARYQMQRQTSKSFRIVWTVRDSKQAEFTDVQEVLKYTQSDPRIEFCVYDSKQSGRLDAQKELESFLGGMTKRTGRIWLYASGPPGLLDSTQEACLKIQKGLKKKHDGPEGTNLEWHVASYSH